MSSSSMASRSALALAVMGLVGMSLPMQAAAQASSAVVTKPALKTAPAKAGSGRTANMVVNDGAGNGGSTMICTVGEDGKTTCTAVESSGSSTGGGGDDPFYLPIENPQGKPTVGGGQAGGATAGGTVSDPKEEERKKNKDNFDKECDNKREKMDAADNLILQSNIKQCNDTYGGGWFGAPLGSVWNLALLGLPMRTCLTQARNTYSSSLSANVQNLAICKNNNPYK